jgi:hypothetical protein
MGRKLRYGPCTLRNYFEGVAKGMDFVGLLQWPAMVVTIVAAWLVASSQRGRRNAGFWLFLISNALWIAWALHVDAPALIVLKVGLATMNIRGAFKTEEPAQPTASEEVGSSNRR